VKTISPESINMHINMRVEVLKRTLETSFDVAYKHAIFIYETVAKTKNLLHYSIY